jgi:hypothetical protein
LGQRKSDLMKQVTSQKRFISYEIFYDRARKRCPFNIGGCLIEVTAWAGLTVYVKICYNLNILPITIPDSMITYAIIITL